MLVYGDRSESADPAERLNSVARQIDRVRAMPPGLERHSALVHALIEAGQQLQGVADAEGETDALTDFLVGIARAVCRSCDSGFAEIGELPGVPEIDGLPEQVELR